MYVHKVRIAKVRETSRYVRYDKVDTVWTKVRMKKTKDAKKLRT